jgi:hypothetical protein
MLNAKLSQRSSNMPKKTPGSRHKRPRLTPDEPRPPYLNEKLIAQLQGAVSAALRKRIAKPIDGGQGGEPIP